VGELVPIRIFARNYRGFKHLDVDLSTNLFITGDNSSGKSSILLLLQAVLRSELNDFAQLDERLTSEKWDFFSPYFSYADVDIGFIANEGSKPLGKMITIKRPPPGAPPLASRMTWIEDGQRFTFKRSEKAAGLKISTFDGELTSEALYHLHHETSGFKALPLDDQFVGSGANSSEVVYSAIRSLRTNDKLTKLMFNSVRIGRLPSTLHSGPIRGLPERFYYLDRKIKASGTHFASMWHDMAEAREKIGMEAVKTFGRESSLFEDLSVEKISKKVPNSPLMVTVKKHGKSFLLSQVGVGVSQVIPIVVESAFQVDDPSSNIILLQQPELHLHPMAQAALGEFLYSMAQRGIRYVVETHSDYLIDRYRAKVREDKAGSGAILFCENRPDGNFSHHIAISEDGELQSPPENYKDFFVTELMRTMF
jgi:energy-coupling factor transporter ATP-binding protein EcfA2